MDDRIHTGSATLIDIWTYPDRELMGSIDLSGFKVEATDGEIGTVDEATYEVGASYLVVDTGPWIFGKKTMLPAGVIERIDPDDRRIWVNRTKDEIKNAPEFDESSYHDTSYRSDIGDYYELRRRGYRE